MKILITARLPESTVEPLRREHDVIMSSDDRPMERSQLLESVCGADGIISLLSDKINTEVYDRAPNLKMVANYAVGFDNIDIPGATQRGIKVSNTPDVLSAATADLTFGLLLAVARRIVEGDRFVRSGKFKFLAPLFFLSTEVHEKTLGIIGLGGIGRLVAKRARGFDMKVLYHNRRRIPEAEERELNVTYVNLNTLLTESDFVSLNCPLTPETRHLLSSPEFKIMKNSAFVINASRGPVIDEQALIEALKTGEIAGAGLDVFENEPQLTPGLAELPNVVLMPHVASATLETRTKIAEVAVKNMLAGLRGERPPNCLNCE